MRKKIHMIVGVIVLAVLAAAGLTAINYRRAQQAIEPLPELIAMPESVLPEVAFVYEDQLLNEVCGYAEALDMNLVRGNITPVTEEMKLSAVVTLHDSHVTGISFQVRSLGDGKLMEDTIVEKWDEKGNQISVDIVLSTLIQQDVEYLLDLILETETHGAVHYYTRIKGGAHKSVLELIQFAQNFSQGTFDKNQSILVPYMLNQTPKTEDNLAYVDLNSRYAVLTWYNYAPVKSAETKLSITELGNEQISLTMEYPIQIAESDGTKSSYVVKEFYCLRMRGNQVYILNYNRTMEEDHAKRPLIIEKGRINMGMATDVPELVTSENGAYVAMVYRNELWLYEAETEKIQLLYSDISAGNASYDIQIASVQEDGTVAFVVYGYVGRGEFEGTNKLCCYEYSRERNALTRKLYIPISRTYEFLKGKQTLSVYGNQQGEYYIRLDNGIYCMKPDVEGIITISENVKDDAFFQSEAGNILAWQEDDIYVLNMDTGVIKTVTAASGQFISMEGLNGNDLVYGIGKEADKGYLENGQEVMPLYALVIMNPDGEEQHRYEKIGYYIADTWIETGRIVMERYRKETKEKYVSVDRDVLLSANEDGANSNVTVSTVANGNYRYDQVLCMTNMTSVSVRGTKNLPQLSLEPAVEIVLEHQKVLTGAYQVYGEGGLLLETNYLTEAIDLAFGTAGTVTGENLFTYWFRSSRKNYVLLPYENRLLETTHSNLLNCMEVMIQVLGKEPDQVKSIWKTEKDVLKTLEAIVGEEVIELQGTKVAQILYYIDGRSPVLIQMGKEMAYLLVGYSGNNVMLYDGSGDLQIMKQGDLENIMEGTNPSLYAYIAR